MLERISNNQPEQRLPDIGIFTRFVGDPLTTTFKEGDLPRSQRLFDAAVALLSPKMTGECSFEHVGSSAMAGMPGKGSIDIMAVFEEATARSTTVITDNFGILEGMGFTSGITLGWTSEPKPELDSVFVADISIPTTQGAPHETETVILHMVPPTSKRAVEFAIIKWLGEESEVFRSQYRECKQCAFRTQSDENGVINRIKFGELKRGILSTSVKLVQAMMDEPESAVTSINQVRDWCKINTKRITEFESKLLAKLNSQTAKELMPSHTAV